MSAAPVAEVPAGVVTVTLTGPALPPGLDVTIWVAEATKNGAAVVPKCTAVAPTKLVPVMVTPVPPAVEPETGLTAVTVGPGAAMTAMGVPVNWAIVGTVEVVTAARRQPLPLRPTALNGVHVPPEKKARPLAAPSLQTWMLRKLNVVPAPRAVS